MKLIRYIFYKIQGNVLNKGISKIKPFRKYIEYNWKGSKFLLLNNSYPLANHFLLNEMRGYLKDINLKGDETIIDCGAYFGWFSIALKAKYPNLKIYCFEPLKESAKILRKNIEINNMQDIKIINAGVYNKSTPLKFSGEGEGFHFDLNGKQEINCIRLEDFIKKEGIEKVDLIKMDIEGAEVYALEGLGKGITNVKDIVVASYHEDLEDRQITCVKLSKIYKNSSASNPPHITTHIKNGK